MKKSLALILALIMVLCMLPVTALAANNSTVVLHPATGTTPTGFKVSVEGKINGYEVTKIDKNNFEITIDLGTYNVSIMDFRIPLPEEVWEGVKMQYNPQTYVIAGTAGAVQKTPGSNALLGNGKNTFYYYNLGSSGGSGEYLWKFTLNYDANGGIGAPASQFYGTNDKYTKSYTFTLATTTPTRDGYTFLGWAKDKTATSATHQPGGSYLMSQTVSGYNGGSVSETLYAVWANPNPSESPNPTPTPSESPNPTPTPSESPNPTPTPSESPNPTPTPSESPNPTPTPNIPWVPGHDHNHNNNGVPPIVYIPPKTGDMPFWYSIAQFLGLVK